MQKDQRGDALRACHVHDLRPLELRELVAQGDETLARVWRKGAPRAEPDERERAGRGDVCYAAGGWTRLHLLAPHSSSITLRSVTCSGGRACWAMETRGLAGATARPSV